MEIIHKCHYYFFWKS